MSQNSKHDLSQALGQILGEKNVYGIAPLVDRADHEGAGNVAHSPQRWRRNGTWPGISGLDLEAVVPFLQRLARITCKASCYQFVHLGCNSIDIFLAQNPAQVMF